MLTSTQKKMKLPGVCKLCEAPLDLNADDTEFVSTKRGQKGFYHKSCILNELALRKSIK